MRNLLQYPVTEQEKADAIDWAIHRADEETANAIGSILPVALRAIRDDLDRLK